MYIRNTTKVNTINTSKKGEKIMGTNAHVVEERSKFLGKLAITLFIIGVGILFLNLIIGSYFEHQKVSETKATIRMWADKLDSSTYDTGVYKKIDGPDINEGKLEVTDGWGKNLQYQYSMGGAMEVVKVMSAGKDGKFYTDDDLVMEKHSVNLKGIGTGLKKNVGEFAHNASKGVITGAAEGAKEAGVVVFAKAKESAGNKVTKAKESAGSKITGAKNKITSLFKRNKEEPSQE